MQQFRCKVADEKQGKLILRPQDGLNRRKQIDLHRIGTDGRRIVNRECTTVLSRGWKRKELLAGIKL